MAEVPKTEKSIRDLLRPRMTKAQVKRAVLRDHRRLQELGIHSPRGIRQRPRKREWSLAQWFSDFVNASDQVSVRRFEKHARLLASVKSSSGLREDITPEKLLWVQSEVRGLIDWSLQTNPGPAPLNPSLKFSPLWEKDGKRVTLRIIGEDFTARLLSHLFDVLSSPRSFFARCKVCQKVFARSGRQLYCGKRCLEKARPTGDRKKYFRDYMRKRRAGIKKLEKKAPDLAEKVEGKKLTLRQALREFGRR